MVVAWHSGRSCSASSLDTPFSPIALQVEKKKKGKKKPVKLSQLSTCPPRRMYALASCFTTIVQLCDECCNCKTVNLGSEFAYSKIDYGQSTKLIIPRLLHPTILPTSPFSISSLPSHTKWTRDMSHKSVTRRLCSLHHPCFCAPPLDRRAHCR